MRRLLFLVLTIKAFAAPNFSDFETYQERYSRSEVEERLGRYLQKDGKVGSYFSLSDETFTLYTAPETEKERQEAFVLRLKKGEATLAEPPKKRTSLVGVKIAIDPGHLGGQYARLEERYIDIPPSLGRERTIQFDEGTLSFLTALYLKILLEKEGAIVMITRDEIGKSVYPQDFFDWLKKSPELWSGSATLSQLFRKAYYPLDLKARAKKINAFAPALSLMIHYNAHHVEDESSSNSCVAAQNYNLVFIPGAFCRNELASEEGRYEFIRLLVTDDLSASKELSAAILTEFTRHLKIPTVTKADGVHYLDRVALKVDEGLYARNLALTRLVHGPLCYGETLIQNNIDECQNLSRQDFVIGGHPCSSRIKQVAEAYFDGIKTYLLK